MLGNALSGERAIQAALLQSNELLIGITGDTDNEIKPIFQVALEKERYFDRPIARWIPLQLSPPEFEYPGMNQAFQPPQLPFVGKHFCCQNFTVYNTFRSKD